MISFSPARAHPPLQSARPGRPDHIGASHPPGRCHLPILAGVQIRQHDHVPARPTPIDRDYEHLRTDMATLFRHMGIQPGPAAA